MRGTETETSPGRRRSALPEFDIAATAFLLHFVWEFWQAPWFEGMREIAHVEGIYICSRAAFGDSAIALLAYSSVAAFARNRLWVLNATTRRVSIYLAIGLIVTVLFEWMATDVLDRWQYEDGMPTLPLIGTGLTPLLQWLTVPLIVLAIVRRLWSAPAPAVDFNSTHTARPGAGTPPIPPPRTRERTAAHDRRDASTPAGRQSTDTSHRADAPKPRCQQQTRDQSGT